MILKERIKLSKMHVFTSHMLLLMQTVCALITDRIFYDTLSGTTYNRVITGSRVGSVPVSQSIMLRLQFW